MVYARHTRLLCLLDTLSRRKLHQRLVFHAETDISAPKMLKTGNSHKCRKYTSERKCNNGCLMQQIAKRRTGTGSRSGTLRWRRSDSRSVLHHGVSRRGRWTWRRATIVKRSVLRMCVWTLGRPRGRMAMWMCGRVRHAVGRMHAIDYHCPIVQIQRHRASD